jgi:hypothetical protein
MAGVFSRRFPLIEINIVQEFLRDGKGQEIPELNVDIFCCRLHYAGNNRRRDMSIQTTAAFRERQNASLERSKRTAAALDQAIKEDLAEIVNDASGEEVGVGEALNRLESED